MHCRRCRVQMAELPGTHHKQKKWRCPKCGRHRMEAVSLKRRRRQRLRPRPADRDD